MPIFVELTENKMRKYAFKIAQVYCTHHIAMRACVCVCAVVYIDT